MYTLLRKFLFLFDAESTHYLTLKFLKIAKKLKILDLFFPRILSDPRTLLGLQFPNKVGLAAGLDKNGEYIDALATLGFGFIEIGTVTPRAQLGNPRPRLFRLIPEQAIINRMGFNNKGVAFVKSQLQKTRYKGILGINIGKNRDTRIEDAISDYVFCFKELAPFASYITINISSPNTTALRSLQNKEALIPLLAALKQEQQLLAETKSYVPLLVKLAPDLNDEELTDIATVLLAQKIDGVIATNTTISRENIKDSPLCHEAGGLSGSPLSQRSTEVIKKLSILLNNKIPIIGVGGIMDQETATHKIAAGAQLLQIYTGFIYSGPTLIKKIIQM